MLTRIHHLRVVPEETTRTVVKIIKYKTLNTYVILKKIIYICINYDVYKSI